MKIKGGYLLGGMLAGLYLWVMVFGNDPLQPMIASKILRNEHHQGVENFVH